MEEKIIAMLKKIAEDEELEVTPESRMMEDLEFSSLELMMIVAEAEEKFGIHIKERELQSIYTVQDLINVVNKKVK